MPDATQQVAVLVEGDSSSTHAVRAAQVLERATALGGVVVDAQTQLLLDVEQLAQRT